MTQENSIVKMHNNLAEARYQLNKIEQKIFIYAIRQIDQTKTDFEEVELKISELSKIAEISEKNMLTKIKLNKYVKNIMRTVIETFDVDEKGRERMRMYNLTQRAEHVEGEAIIKFKFNKDMMPLLLDLQKNFFIQSPIVITFASTHSMRIYDFFKEKAWEKNEWNTTIDEFKEQIGLEGKYKVWKDLKKEVIERAMKEIKKTDLILSYEIKKRGRSAHYLEFKFKTIDQSDSIFYENGATRFKDTVDDLRESLGEKIIQFTDGQVYEFYALSLIHEPQHEDAKNYILRTIDYMNRPKKKPIKNRYSYLKKALEEGYVFGQMTIKI